MNSALAALAGVLTLLALAALFARRASDKVRLRILEVACLCAFAALVLAWFAAVRFSLAEIAMMVVPWGLLVASAAASFAILVASRVALRRRAGEETRWLSPVWRRRLAYGMASGLLILVATHQMVRSQTGTLAVWKGGGFGMFAEVESRFIRVEVEVGGKVLTGVGWNTGHIRTRLKALQKNPDLDEMGALAQTLAERRWRPTIRRVGGRDVGVHRMSKAEDVRRGVKADTIRLQAWDAGLEGGALTPRLLEEVTHQRQGSP